MPHRSRFIPITSQKTLMMTFCEVSHNIYNILHYTELTSTKQIAVSSVSVRTLGTSNCISIVNTVCALCIVNLNYVYELI